jgi:hypothetical protein
MIIGANLVQGYSKVCVRWMISWLGCVVVPSGRIDELPDHARRQLRLWHEPGCGRFLYQIREVRLCVRRDQDHRGIANVRLREPPGEIKAAFVPEHDVYEDDVGAQFSRFPERIGDGRRSAHYRQSLSLEDVGGSLQKGCVVVNYEAPERHSSMIPCEGLPKHCREQESLGGAAGVSALSHRARWQKAEGVARCTASRRLGRRGAR